MVKILNIVIYFCIAASFSGCGPAEKEKPIWQGIKIGDLSPLKNSRKNFLLKTINFDVYTFEMPKSNIGFLEEIFSLFYTEPILFNDPAAFGANSFALGLTGMEQWDSIAELLDAAEGERIEKITLLLSASRIENINIKMLDFGKDISYFSSAHQLETISPGAGRIVMRIEAERIPGSRGVCALNVKPVFVPLSSKQNEYMFTPLSFTVRISPGYLLFLGPAESVGPKDSLSNLFFSKKGEYGKTEYIKTYLLVCTGIVD